MAACHILSILYQCDALFTIPVQWWADHRWCARSSGKRRSPTCWLLRSKYGLVEVEKLLDGCCEVACSASILWQGGRLCWLLFATSAHGSPQKYHRRFSCTQRSIRSWQAPTVCRPAPSRLENTTDKEMTADLSLEEAWWVDTMEIRKFKPRRSPQQWRAESTDGATSKQSQRVQS